LQLLEGAGEAIPLPDASQDAITCVFLLHELPKKIRVQMAREMARVLKPGGRVVLIDSLQYGDRPDWDGLLDLFPHYFHEPYYADYVRTDIAALMADAGFMPRDSSLAYLAKVMVFDRA
jgi:ubiquinone/menaquinone biosynthesis C-methylase UbiE